jgi:hypothetical protein
MKGSYRTFQPAVLIFPLFIQEKFNQTNIMDEVVNTQLAVQRAKKKIAESVERRKRAASTKTEEFSDKTNSEIETSREFRNRIPDPVIFAF